MTAPKLLTPAQVAELVGTYPQEIRMLARDTRAAKLPGAPIHKGRRGGARMHLRWRADTAQAWYDAALVWLAEQPIPEAELAAEPPKPAKRKPAKRKAAAKRPAAGHGSKSGGRMTGGTLLAKVYAKAG